MKQVGFIEKLDKLSYFNTETVSQLSGLTGNSLYKNLSRKVRNGDLIRIKKGDYVTKNFTIRVKEKDAYLEFIANKLIVPSYLSLEYVLDKYQILSESVFAYTSITSKATRIYSNQLGNFIYRSITNSLFVGYQIVEKDGYDIAIATKSKALFDYLYLKFFRKKDIRKETIDDLRLNLDSFTKKEIREFAKYCKLTGIKKYSDLTKTLFSLETN